MSVNKYNNTTGQLETLASGQRMWIGTKAAYDAAVQAGTMENDILIAITDDDDDYKTDTVAEDDNRVVTSGGVYDALNNRVTVQSTGTVIQTLTALASAMDFTKVTPRAVIATADGEKKVYHIGAFKADGAENKLLFTSIHALGTPYEKTSYILLTPTGANAGLIRKDSQSGSLVDSTNGAASDHFGTSITLYY